MVSAEVFILVICSAVFHATWNFCARKVKGNMGVMWLSFSFGTILTAPVGIYFFYEQLQKGYPNGQLINSVYCLVASGLVNGLYLITLSLSYKFGDITVVYPVARGTGLSITAMFSYFVLKDYISIMGWCGIFGIIVGILLIGVKQKPNLEPIQIKFFKIIHGKAMSYSFSRGRDSIRMSPTAIRKSLNIMKKETESGTGDAPREVVIQKDENSLKIDIQTDANAPAASPPASPQVSRKDYKEKEIPPHGLSTSQTSVCSTEEGCPESSPQPSPPTPPASSTLPIAIDPARVGSTLKAIGFAIITGAIISSYSIIDSLGVNRFELNPVAYMVGVEFIACVVIAPFVLIKHKDQCVEAAKEKKKFIAFIGPCSFGCYIAILYAFQLGKVSYVVSIREVAVVIGCILGFVLLKEKFTIRKGLGITCITAGLVLVKLS